MTRRIRPIGEGVVDAILVVVAAALIVFFFYVPGGHL